MKKVLIEIKNGEVKPIAIPEGVEIEIANHDNNSFMVERTIYEKEKNKNKVEPVYFGTGKAFSKEEIKESFESHNL